MTESTVKISMRDENGLGCSYAIITKDKMSIIIILKDQECAIFHYDDLRSREKEVSRQCEYHYLLLKHYDSDSYAYKDFLKLIGKMCKKGRDSKYYANPQNEDNRMICGSTDDEHMIKAEERPLYEERYFDFKCFVLGNQGTF